MGLVWKLGHIQWDPIEPNWILFKQWYPIESHSKYQWDSMGFNGIGVGFRTCSMDPVESHWIIIKQWDPIESLSEHITGTQWDSMGVFSSDGWEEETYSCIPTLTPTMCYRPDKSGIQRLATSRTQERMSSYTQPWSSMVVGTPL